MIFKYFLYKKKFIYFGKMNNLGIFSINKIPIKNITSQQNKKARKANNVQQITTRMKSTSG